MQEIELECVLVQYPNPRFKWSAKRFPDTEISTSLHQRLPALLTSRTPYQLNYAQSYISPSSAFKNRSYYLTTKVEICRCGTSNIRKRASEDGGNTQIV